MFLAKRKGGSPFVHACNSSRQHYGLHSETPGWILFLFHWTHQLPLIYFLFPVVKTWGSGEKPIVYALMTLTQICVYPRVQLCHLCALRLPGQLWCLKMAYFAFLSLWRVRGQDLFCSCHLSPSPVHSHSRDSAAAASSFCLKCPPWK